MTLSYECDRCHKVYNGAPGGANYQGDECPACEWDGRAFDIEREITDVLERIAQQQDELARLHDQRRALGPHPSRATRV